MDRWTDGDCLSLPSCAQQHGIGMSSSKVPPTFQLAPPPRLLLRRPSRVKSDLAWRCHMHPRRTTSWMYETEWQHQLQVVPTGLLQPLNGCSFHLLSACRGICAWHSLPSFLSSGALYINNLAALDLRAPFLLTTTSPAHLTCTSLPHTPHVASVIPSTPQSRPRRDHPERHVPQPLPLYHSA